MPKTQLGFQVIQRLGHTYRAMQAGFNTRVGHALPRWRILLTLWENGQCSQKHLAEHCRLDPASLTRQLQAMQQMGWLERHADPQDNRLTNVCLTDAGRAVVADALPRREAFLEEALGGLTAQQIESLDELLTLLEASFLQATRARAEA